MFSEVASRWESYKNQIPENTMDTVLKSATYSFMVNMLIVRGHNPAASYNLARPLVMTAISAIASAIYGLATPLFQVIFNTKNSDRIYLHHEFIKIAVVNVMTSALLAYTTAAKVNLFAFAWLPMIPFNFFISTIELAPAFLEWIGDNDLARSTRDDLDKWGLKTRSDSGSIFLAM